MAVMESLVLQMLVAGRKQCCQDDPYHTRDSFSVRAERLTEHVSWLIRDVWQDVRLCLDGEMIDRQREKNNSIYGGMPIEGLNQHPNQTLARFMIYLEQQLSFPCSTRACQYVHVLWSRPDRDDVPSVRFG